MLLKNLTEVKQHISVNVTENIANITPYILQAEQQFIIPAISKEEYDLLDAAYNVTNPSLTTFQTNLLKKIQAALVHYTYYLYLPVLQVQISSAGVQIVSTETKKTAFPWQIKELQASWLRSANVCMDDLLAFMEANKINLTQWPSTAAYTEYKELFITTTEDFHKQFSINNSRLVFK